MEVQETTSEYSQKGIEAFQTSVELACIGEEDERIKELLQDLNLNFQSNGKMERKRKVPAKLKESRISSQSDDF